MKEAWTCVLCLFLHVLAAAPVGDVKIAEFPPKRGKYVVYVERIKDGDTIKFYYLVPEERGRLWGINTPEIDTDAGKAARSALQAMVPPGLHEVEFLGPEKFGGVMLRIRNKDGDVVTQMIGAGHGKPWDGRGKKP